MNYVSCIGGNLPGQIFDKMPQKSLMIVVGSLSEKDLILPASEFYLESKSIRGFFLEKFLKEELTQQEFKDFCNLI